MASINIKDLMLVDRTINLNSGIVVGVIGCGGTGSLFIRDAMRIIKVFNEGIRRQGAPGVEKVFFCDADIVEDKNLIRQNFLPQDIGRNKAEVLAERYGGAFDMPVSIVPRFIESEMDLYNTMREDISYFYHKTVILFSMVDNVKTRLMISNFVNGYVASKDAPTNIGCDLVVVDCGNSEFAGQVCVSASATASTGRFFLPSVAELNPDLLDKSNWDKFASELSCEEAAISAPQSIAANATAANIAMNIFYNLLFRGGVNYNKVVFNAQNNSNVTDFLRKNNYKFTKSMGYIDYK